MNHLLEIRKLTPDCTSPLTGYLAAPIKLTNAQTIELSAGTTYCTSIAGDAPALVLLRG